MKSQLYRKSTLKGNTMEKKADEVIIDGLAWKIKPKGMTITQLPCTTKRAAIKVFNQLKPSIPENYKAVLVKYDYSVGHNTGDIYSDCPYYMIVSQYRFKGFSWVVGV